MCLESGIRIRKLQIAIMCNQYEAMMRVCVGPNWETKYPRGSQNFDGPSPDSITNDVEVIVRISRRIAFPST